MPQTGITFDGQYFSLPGVYYSDNVSALAQAPPPATPPLLFIGYGWGPAPKAPQFFTNPQDLLVALRGSPAAAFVPFMATPSPSMNGAQRITFIDASTNTQASVGLNTSGTTQTTLTSVLYGPPSNQLSAQISAGTTAGLKVTLNDGYSHSVAIGDNLTVPLLLAYSGAATGGVTYTMTTGAVSGTFSISSPIAGESVSIPVGPGSYSTAALLSQYLNGTGFYYAQLLSSTQGNLPAQQLSAVSATALPIPSSGGVLNYVNVNAYLHDIAYWVNNFAGSMATAVVSGSALDSAAWLPVTGAATFFSGARGIPPTNADYAAALTAGLTVPAWTVFCDSSAAGVQALLTAHCEMAGHAPYSAWRRGFTGSSVGDTVATAQTASTNLNAYQMNYVYPGIYRINPLTNAPQLYSGLYAAAAAAAMATGNQIAQPLTNKPLTATGIELANAGAPLSPSQIAALQNSGVMVIQSPQQTGIPSILSDVTTWENDNNPANTSSQQVACRFWTAYSMVAGLQQFVGTIAAPLTEIAILNAAKRILNSLVFTGGSSSGVLASWEKNSLVLVFTGASQLAAISFTATLVSQNRFITVMDTIAPLNFTVNLSV